MKRLFLSWEYQVQSWKVVPMNDRKTSILYVHFGTLSESIGGRPHSHFSYRCYWDWNSKTEVYGYIVSKLLRYGDHSGRFIKY